VWGVYQVVPWIVTAWCLCAFAAVGVQVVRVAWSRRHVQVWAVDVMGFRDSDAEALAPWRGRSLAEANSAPLGMSPTAAASLMRAVESGDWGLLQAQRRGPS
jgi:hypothetical protein